MWALIKSLGLNRWNFWKTGRYIVWRLHTAYGISNDLGVWQALSEVIKKIGFIQFVKEAYRLNRWLKSINKSSHF